MRFFLRFMVCVILLITGTFCNAAIVDDPDDPNRVWIDPVKYEVENIKEYKEYFDDYTKRLYENFHPEKKFIFGQCELFLYFINRDGSIEHLDNFFKNNRYAHYGKKIIRNTPAYPFPEQIKDDKIFVAMYLSYWAEDKVEIDLYGRTTLFRSFYWKRFYSKPSINLVDIEIEKQKGTQRD